MNPIMILIILTLLFYPRPAHAELTTGMSADVVIGQKDFVSNAANQGLGGANSNTLYHNYKIFCDGAKLYIADASNHRILFFNSIPSTNDSSADTVIGQPDFTSNSANQGGAGSAANTLYSPSNAFFDGKKLFISDQGNNRVLIFNSFPSGNNVPADVVIGQPDFTSNSINQGGAAPGSNTLYQPTDVFSDGTRLFIIDYGNHRALIFNRIPTANNTSADVVIGQPDFTSSAVDQGGGPAANTVGLVVMGCSDGKRLFLSDGQNHRVLIYNSIPTMNNASADIVIGQPDFTSGSYNQGGDPGPNTLKGPKGVTTNGKRLFIAEDNHRILVFNSIPTGNNAYADIVIGQPNFTSNSVNQGGGPKADTLNYPRVAISDGRRLYVDDERNNRVLIYNIGVSSIKNGPQFDQGKALIGKVFNDVNANGIQDNPTNATNPTNAMNATNPTNAMNATNPTNAMNATNPITQQRNNAITEPGIEGVKVVSDTGIYAITDPDGKYHFPYIEVGQHLLKIDESTLPEGSVITTDNPYHVTVTEGVLTKVSFAVQLPRERNNANNPTNATNPINANNATNPTNANNQPLLKVSISQDPVMLKPRLSISHKIVSSNSEPNNPTNATNPTNANNATNELIEFTITCNYHLFIVRSNIKLYDKDYNLIKTIDLPNPIPSIYTLPLNATNATNANNAITLKPPPASQKSYSSRAGNNPTTLYYQLSVYDKNNKEDRTGIGEAGI